MLVGERASARLGESNGSGKSISAEITQNVFNVQFRGFAPAIVSAV